MVTFSAALLNDLPREAFVETVTAIDASLRYENLFVADERFYRNPYAQLAVAAEHTTSVGLATGVTNPYTRNPVFTAAGIATIDELSDGRAHLGFGAGSPMVLDPLGVDQSAPIGTLRDAVDVVRTLHRGESVSIDRSAFTLDDVGLDFTPRGEVPIYVAGRGPQILSLGGHVGDGVIAGAGLTSPDGMAYAMDRIRRGAEHGGRSVDAIDVVCWAFLSIADDREVALDAVAPLVARIVGAVPMETLAAIGVPREDAATVKAIDDVDGLSPTRLREVVPRSVVEQFSIVGTPAQCREHVERLLDVGVEHVAVLPFKNETRDELGNLQAFSKEVASVLDHA